ncbi:hypothetical protein L218DRAFT_867051, partial [Marasmius fiardii PR-910]
SQVLQEKISILENRIKELQTSGASSTTIQLHDPYAGHNKTSSSRGSEINTRHLRDFQAASPEARRMAIMPFLSNASELGFFLDIHQFCSGVETGTGGPSPSLLPTVLLIADFVSHGGGASPNESDYLALAVQATSRGLTDHHPKTVLHTIQANVLLAYYFHLKGKSVEGQYYTSTAVSLVLGTGLHQIRSSDPRSMSGSLLPPPKDVLEEGERINAVWAVVSLNSFWSAAGRYSSNIDYQVSASRVDVPWPLETPGYVSTPLPRNLRNSHTIQNFLSNVPDGGYSLPALYSKACLLFEQASMLNHQYSPNMSQEKGRQFSRSCDQLSAVLKRFNAELPLPSSAEAVPSQRRLLVIYTLSHVALIQLHYAFAGHSADSRSQCLSAAHAVVKSLRSVGLQDYNKTIDPAFAVSLTVR